jgi:predicted PurR-regulated permease PerM
VRATFSLEDRSGQSERERGLRDTMWRRRGACALMVIAIVAGFWALHAAAGVVAPMLLSVLCALLLAPPVKWLTRLGLPRAFASALVLCVLVVLLGFILDATWQPARSWLAAAPRTMLTIEGKLRPLQTLFQQIDHVGREAQRFSGAGRPAPPESASIGLPMTAMTIVPGAAMTLVTSLAFIFLLLVTGPGWLERIKDAVNERQHRRVVLLIETVRIEVSRYLLTIAAIGVVLGTATTLLVHAFGIPNALLWGTMAAVFSLVPYFGSVATLSVLTVVGLVTFDRLAPVLGLSGLFLLMQILEGEFIQPFLVGRRLELNPVAVVLAIWLFGALWGLSGVVLAVPLLLTLKATASHIEALHVLLPLIGCNSACASSSSAQSAPGDRSARGWRHNLRGSGATGDSDELVS